MQQCLSVGRESGRARGRDFFFGTPLGSEKTYLSIATVSNNPTIADGVHPLPGCGRPGMLPTVEQEYRVLWPLATMAVMSIPQS